MVFFCESDEKILGGGRLRRGIDRRRGVESVVYCGVIDLTRDFPESGLPLLGRGSIDFAAAAAKLCEAFLTN